ncbi:MAG: alpha/beta hydrolase [Actinomycetota bacterium]
MSTEIAEYTLRTDRHTTGYLAAGPADGPLIVFVHGWPELSISWRHQLPAMAGLGFRAVAPDMRGYGRSSTYEESSAFAQEEAVADMIELLDHLGRDRAVWVGHDWGAPVVWNLASHHPERCRAVANLCVPYRTIEAGWDRLIELVDRDVYPEDEFPVGQWDYQLYYRDDLDRAVEVMEADTYLLAKALFRKGNPDGASQPAVTASIRAAGGWFGGADVAPDIPRDDDVVTEADLRHYAAAMDRNGFFGPSSWYLNHEANERYAAEAVDDGALSLPVLFLAARFDATLECTRNQRLLEPMRAACADLTERTVDSGHWMAQERPHEVNAGLVAWLRDRVPDHWPPTGA